MPPSSCGWPGAHRPICLTIARFFSTSGNSSRKGRVRKAVSMGMSSLSTNSRISPRAASVFSESSKSMITPRVFPVIIDGLRKGRRTHTISA